MKYITKNIKQFYTLKWHNRLYKLNFPTASKKKCSIRLLRGEKVTWGEKKIETNNDDKKKSENMNIIWWKLKRTKCEMKAQMMMEVYSSFTWGPVHFGGVEGTSRSGMMSGGWNNRTIQTPSITTDTRNSGSTTVRQGDGVQTRSTFQRWWSGCCQIRPSGREHCNTIPVTQTQLTPPGQTRAYSRPRKEGKYSNGRKCQKYKHETKK